MRVPKWAVKPATVRVNHRVVNAKAVPGTFLKISRRWREDDTVTVTFPKSLRFEPIDAQTPGLAALMYGPIMLVALADGEVILHGDEAKPEQWIKLQDTNSLTFCTASGQLFRPFYQLGEEERYTTYCRFAPADHNFARWEKEISAFEQSDQTNPPPKNAVLFTGSSVIRKWTSLAQDFPGQPVINRGFGGCAIKDCTHFASRIIFPCQPRVIFLRAGDNELWDGESSESVFVDFKEFVAAVHAKLPRTEIVYITSNPCPSRWKQADKEKHLGDLIDAYCQNTPGVKCIDTFDMVLGADGKPRPELFVADRLHLNAAGYKLLAAHVQPFLTN